MKESKNIRLRAIEPQDVDFILETENDPENWRLSETLFPFSRYEIEDYVFNGNHDIFAAKQLRLIIEEKASSKQAGSIDLFDFNPLHKRAGVGIIINKAYRRKGYAAEALEILKDYVFRTLDLHQLYCNIQEENAASIELFEKAGFVKQCVKKDWEYFEGKYRNVFFYVIFNDLH